MTAGRPTSGAVKVLALRRAPLPCSERRRASSAVRQRAVVPRSGRRARTPEKFGNDPNTSRACVPPSASRRSPATPNTDSAASLQARSPGFRSLTMAVVCSCSTTSSPSPHLPGRSPHRVRLSSVAASQGSPPSHSLDGHWHTRVIRNPGTAQPTAIRGSVAKSLMDAPSSPPAPNLTADQLLKGKPHEHNSHQRHVRDRDRNRHRSVGH